MYLEQQVRNFSWKNLSTLETPVGISSELIRLLLKCIENSMGHVTYENTSTLQQLGHLDHLFGEEAQCIVGNP